MSKLWSIFIASLILAALAERNSVYTIGRLGEKQYVRRDRFFFIILAVTMAVFVGLRTSYNDTYAYIQGYNNTASTGSLFEGINWLEIGTSPAFNFSQRVLRHLGVSSQSFLMLFAVITVGIYLWFIRKYTDNIWLSVFLFSTMGIYTFTMAAIRQCVAVAFALVATDRAIQRKWISFVFWVIVAVLFHPYAIMYFIVPLLTFNPWTGKTYIMLVIFAVVGFSLQAMVGTILDITSLMGKEYDATAFSGEGVNVFRLAVVWVPVLLSFLAKRFLQNNNDRASNLIMNLSMLNAEIMFVALFGTANYFARLANYFLIFQAISLPWLFQFYNKRSKQLLTMGAVACYFLYFYYANSIYGGFDALYRGISLLDYLKILVGMG